MCVEINAGDPHFPAPKAAGTPTLTENITKLRPSFRAYLLLSTFNSLNSRKRTSSDRQLWRFE